MIKERVQRLMESLIIVHGPWKGLGLALWRVLRCNPFSKGGVDPVPPKKMEYKGK